MERTKRIFKRVIELILLSLFVFLSWNGFGGIGQIAHDDDQAEERGKPDGQVGCGEQGTPDAVNGERSRYVFHDDGGDALPDAGRGFAVILPHDVLCGLCFCGGGLRFSGHKLPPSQVCRRTVPGSERSLQRHERRPRFSLLTGIAASIGAAMPVVVKMHAFASIIPLF